MKIILFKLVLQLEKIINVLLDKLDEKRYVAFEEKRYQFENEIDRECVINDIYNVLNEYE